MKAELLPPVAFRVGLLAVLKSLAGRFSADSRFPGIGVMITASHNPPVRAFDSCDDVLLSALKAILYWSLFKSR